jgi:molybdopterin synthase catalytic subunit
MIDICDGPLPVEQLARAVESPRHGAVVTFLGVVRGNSRGHSIDYLEYQAYRPMALREMANIAQELRERWDVPCAMAHRVGRLEVGEASIAIAVASPHRGVAFEACHYAIDRVKETVPIWKKEVTTDGSWWVEDPHLVEDPHNAAVSQQGAVVDR